MIIEHCTGILKQIEDGKATNWPKLQEAGRDPVTELIFKLLWDQANLRKLKRQALDGCTIVKNENGELKIEAVDEDDLDIILLSAGQMAANVEAMTQAVSDLEQIFTDLNIKEPLFKNIEQRERSILSAIDKAKSEISLAARRVMHTNRDPMSPEEVLSNPKYCEVRAEQTLRIEALEKDLAPIQVGRVKANEILEQFDLLEIDLTGNHFLVPAVA